jgi:hypothetical protein
MQVRALQNFRRLATDCFWLSSVRKPLLRKQCQTLLMALGAIICLTILGCDEEAVCTSDYDCAGTNVCNLETGDCERFTCEFDNQCPYGKTCQNNTCVVADAGR